MFRFLRGVADPNSGSYPFVASVLLSLLSSPLISLSLFSTAPQPVE